MTTSTASGGTLVLASRAERTGDPAPFTDRFEHVVAYLAPRLQPAAVHTVGHVHELAGVCTDSAGRGATLEQWPPRRASGAGRR